MHRILCHLGWHSKKRWDFAECKWRCAHCDEDVNDWL